RLNGALDVERDQVPLAEVVRVPAVARLAEVAGLAIGQRSRLHDAVGEGRVELGPVRGIVREPVVVVEVAEAAYAQLPVVVVELVVPWRGTLEELEGTPVLVERVLEVRVVAVLVLLIAEYGNERRVHRLDLHGGRVLCRVTRRRGDATGAE